MASDVYRVEHLFLDPHFSASTGKWPSPISPEEDNLFDALEEELRKHGIQLHHARDYDEQQHSVFVAFNDTPTVRRRLAGISRRYLLVLEPPCLHIRPWLDARRMAQWYTEAYYCYDLSRNGPLGSVKNWSERFGLLDFPNGQSPLAPEQCRGKRQGLITLIASNRRSPYPLPDVLYRTRRNLILAFRPEEGHVYGRGWTRRDGPTALGFQLGGAVRRTELHFQGQATSKTDVYRRYEFALTVENMSLPSYVSEKIFSALACRTIPVYLGAPDITNFVPGDCFVDVRDFEAPGDLVEFLRAESKESISERRHRIDQFVSSDGFRRFSMHSFARNISNLARAGRPESWRAPPRFGVTLNADKASL